MCSKYFNRFAQNSTHFYKAKKNIMKKLTLITILIFVFQMVNAQEIEGGNKFLFGGSMNLIVQKNPIANEFGLMYSIHSKETKVTLFSFVPYLGVEINPHFTIGMQLDYVKGTYKADVGYLFDEEHSKFKIITKQFGIGIFTRSILNPNNQLKFFLQPYSEYNVLSQEKFHDLETIYEDEAKYIELGLGTGVLYDISDRIRITLKTGWLSYVNGKWKEKDTDNKKEFSEFGANFDLSRLFFGFEIRL